MDGGVAVKKILAPIDRSKYKDHTTAFAIGIMKRTTPQVFYGHKTATKLSLETFFECTNAASKSYLKRPCVSRPLSSL